MGDKIETMVQELRAAGGDVTAASFEAGRTVLLVLTMPEGVSMSEADRYRRAAGELGDELERCGVRAFGVALPHGASLRAFEVERTAT